MPHSVVDQLFEFHLPFAQSQLKKRGKFSPFATATKPDGTLNPIAFYDEEDNLNAETLTAKLAEILTTLARQNEITGSAICYNGVVTVPGKENQTAIIIAMERVTGFDPKTYQDRATYEAPTEFATGVRYLAVNGQHAIDEGKLTAIRSGLRSRTEFAAQRLQRVRVGSMALAAIVTDPSQYRSRILPVPTHDAAA